MEKTTYNVIYLNGKEEMFYCDGFQETIIKAMAFAISKGWDSRIKTVTSEYGSTIQDIFITYRLKP